MRTYVLPGRGGPRLRHRRRRGLLALLRLDQVGDEKSASQRTRPRKPRPKTGPQHEGKLHQAEAEWKAAMEELHQAQDGGPSGAAVARRTRRRSWISSRRTCLSAGRSGDTSLTEAFWTGDLGKDVTLRKAVDVAESQVAEAFADRPRPKPRSARCWAWPT